MKLGYGSKCTLLLAALAASTLQVEAQAQSRPGGTAVGGNPLDSLPQVKAPDRGPSVTVQVEQQAPQLQELLARHLTPTRVQVEGVKSIPFDEVAQRFTPLVGKDITIGELIEVANGVTRLYQERGYALSFAFIPAQSFADGVVRVTVVEGYVSAVKVTGRPGAVEDKIRAIADHIVADRPLRRATFERYINVLGLLPGIKVAANVAPPQNTDGATTLELKVDRKPFDFSAGVNFNQPGVQGLLTATENGLTSLGEQLSVSALLPKGRDNVTYLAAHAAVPIGSNGLIGKIDASHYRGNPVDNPGLPCYVQRTVINDRIGGSLAYPLMLSNTQSVIGTASVYASHDEDRYNNQLTGAQLGLRSQVRVMQLQADYTAVDTGQVRRASVNVAKAFDILGASKSGDSNVPGSPVTNPASINFVQERRQFFADQRMADEDRHLRVADGPVQRGISADVGTDFVRRATFRAGLSAGRSIRRFGLGRDFRSQSPVHAGLHLSAHARAVCLVRHGARLSACGYAVAVAAVVDRVRLPAFRMRSTTAWICRWRRRSAMRRWKALRAARVSTRRSRIS